MQQLSPKTLLALFCALNLVIYGDRGALGSNGVNADGVQAQFGLTLFQDGLLPAAFMVGLLVASPIFAEASKRAGAFRLIGVGLAIWAVATAGCGLALGFWTLLLCRMTVGVGEASFVALAAPFIDDVAPAAHKAQWLAVFYLCIPVGYALGFIYGGLVAGALGWRAAFLLESAAMLPFIAFCLRAPHASLRGTSPAQPPHGARDDSLAGRFGEAARDVAQLGRRPVYLWVVAAMTAYTAVLGALSFYGPQASRQVFLIPPRTADLVFGAVTVATGTLGTLAGGALLDRVGSSLRNGLLLCAGALAAGGALLVAAFSLATSFAAFAAVFAAAELFLFMTAAPSNALALWSVPPALRPLAMSMSVVAIHVFGDVPSPPLLGLLQGRLHNWRASMCVLATLLFAGAAANAFGVAAARTATDFRTVVDPGAAGVSDGGEGGGPPGDGLGHEEEEPVLVAGDGGGIGSDRDPL